MRVAVVLISIGEHSICFNLLENSKSSWTSLLNVVFGATIVRVNPHITQRMKVCDKLDLLLMLIYKLLERLSLWLRERTGASVAFAAGISTIVLKF
jgi:hypothetical protein